VELLTVQLCFARRDLLLHAIFALLIYLSADKPSVDSEGKSSCEQSLKPKPISLRRLKLRLHSMTFMSVPDCRPEQMLNVFFGLGTLPRISNLGGSWL
jgi:hypothetical protein